jgi:hypothetical protein
LPIDPIAVRPKKQNKLAGHIFTACLNKSFFKPSPEILERNLRDVTPLQAYGFNEPIVCEETTLVINVVLHRL